VVHFGHLSGVYAEMTAVPAEFVVPLAADVPLDAAAAVAMNGTTAYRSYARPCTPALARPIGRERGARPTP
jgi:NADPH:quinone reductase-like Zn-dependent oxidoreductase